MEHFILFAADTEFNRYLLLLIPAFVLPFLVLATGFSVYPLRRMVLLMLLPGALSLLALPLEVFALPVLLIDGILLTVCFIDFLTVPFFSGHFHAKRTSERIASLSHEHEVSLRIENRSQKSIFVTIRDDVDPVLVPEPAEFEQREIPGGAAETLEYTLRPKSRGAFYPKFAYLSCRSALGLWRRLITVPCESEWNVYPDLRQIAHYELLARTERLYQLGVKKVRKIGQDNEFERLREYQSDDNFKQINWRATARRNKLMVKDFQAQRNQRIIFMIDCGRMMSNTSKGLTLLDHAFNSMLMLANVAIRQGDSVGLLCFSDHPLYFIPPKSGSRQMNRLLHVCYDIFPRQVESRYDEAFYYLSTQCHKRSLVIFITNVNDEVNATVVQQHLTNLVGKHLPLGVLLRDRKMFEAVGRYEAMVEDNEETGNENSDTPIFVQDKRFWQAAAAAQILNWRRDVIDELSLRGTLTLDSFPEDLTAPLINKYLEVKARQLL